MIQPNIPLILLFTDADLTNEILKKLLQKNVTKTFNAISCDGDTSTNDMISIFSTGKASINRFQILRMKKLKNLIYL